uniref:Uncharacterized protein n=1 Tax=Medicago truncatula TaxID=3880 RepID=I3SCI7_MEDTR|nr:unknown [Medicago truncatula]
MWLKVWRLVMSYVSNAPSCTSVICSRNCLVPFLTSSIPNLSLDKFMIHKNSLGQKLNTNCSFRFQMKLISNKSIQKLRFSNTRVTNHNNLEHIINTLMIQITLKLSHSLFLGDFQ